MERLETFVGIARLEKGCYGTFRKCSNLTILARDIEDLFKRRYDLFKYLLIVLLSLTRATVSQAGPRRGRRRSPLPGVRSAAKVAARGASRDR